MNRPLFKKLELHRTLTAGDFTDRQASTLVASLDSIIRSSVATSEDVAELRTVTVDNISELHTKLASVDANIASMGLQLEGKISESQSTTVKWMFGVMGVQTTAIIGAVIAILKFVRP